MNIRDFAKTIVDSLNEDQLMDFIKIYADDNILARWESDYIAQNPNRKHYNDFSEIVNEIDRM